MKIVDTFIDGLKLITPFVHYDTRGGFVKTFSLESFNKFDLDFSFQESYYSISNKDVIRGMHFQEPPYAVSKLVYVAKGKALDVVLDLRKKSPTYGEFYEVELSEDNNKILFVPEGCAHGFLSRADNTIMTYFQSLPFNQEADSGVSYNSFGMNWGDVIPICSDRDQGHPSLGEFDSPFE